MRFGPVAPRLAVGGIVAHSIRVGDITLKKGVVLGVEQAAALEAAGVTAIVVARLDADDIGEDEAAARLAAAVAGPQLRIDRAFTGRANLFAEAAGLVVLDADAIERVNAVDEGITLATLPPFRVVEAGAMVATVKIIPFAVPAGRLAAAVGAAGGPLLRIAPFRPRRVGVISTLLPGLKTSVVEKTLRVTGERLAVGGSIVAAERRVPHETGALATALGELSRSCELLLVFGASAITDRLDVIPAAIEAAGGSVEHFGMPVDPGNLLLLGSLAGLPVLGAPGCARSPKENGFDWVLQRLMADLPVSGADMRRLGVGGLLMEIVSRPQPREGRASGPVAGVLLAAGRSSRFADGHKLLQSLDGQPIVRHAALAALAAGLAPLVVVTGHCGEEVRAALGDLDVTFVANPDFAEGLSTSLRAGIAAVPEDAAGAVILLGDMPRLQPGTPAQLVARLAAEPAAAAVVPVHRGQRGNPVLIARRLFAALTALSGDAGARRLLEAQADAVLEVEVDDPGVLVDIDTRENLAALQQDRP